jgi:anti-anti-sigma factor
MTLETKTRQIEPDITVLEVSGKMILGAELASLETAIHGLIEAGVRKLVIDLAAVEGMDSSGIGLLVSSSSEIEQAGGHLRLAGAHGSVGKALEVAHLNRITPMDQDIAAACRHLAADSAAF